MGWPGAAGAEPPTGEVRTVPTGRVKTDPTGHPLPPHHPRGAVSLHPSLLSVHLLSRPADMSRNETQRRLRSFCPLRVFHPSVPGDCVCFALAGPRLFKAAEDAEPPGWSPVLEARQRLGGCCHPVVALGIALCETQPESMNLPFENNENIR